MWCHGADPGCIPGLIPLRQGKRLEFQVRHLGTAHVIYGLSPEGVVYIGERLELGDKFGVSQSWADGSRNENELHVFWVYLSR